MAGQAGWFARVFGVCPSRCRVPDGVLVYAVGDVHGRLDLALSLLEKILSDAREHPSGQQKILIFLGDYVDRGPASREVIDWLAALDLPDWTIVKLMGNHEYSLLAFLRDANIYPSWRAYGGGETLLSYGVQPPMFTDPAAIAVAQAEFVAKIPQRHLEFLSGLPFSYEVGDYFFAHAGVRPGVGLERQMAEDLLWIRDDFLSSEQWFGKKIIHGHTPSDEPVVYPNRICVDTGAYATGRLTAVRLLADGYGFLSASDTELPHLSGKVAG